VYSLSQGTFAVLAAKFRHQLVCRGAPRTPVTPLEQPQSAGVGGERVNRRRVGGVDSRHLRCRVDLTHTVTQHTSTPPTYQCTIIPQTRPYTASERAAPWLHCTALQCVVHSEYARRRSHRTVTPTLPAGHLLPYS